MKAHVTWLVGMLIVALIAPAVQSSSLPTRAPAAGPWYVAPEGDDSSDCLSPTTPCATINGAIAKASSGDMIYVATGTYTGSGNEVVQIYRNVALSGGWGASFTAQDGISTIDGDGSRRGITVNSGVTATVERFVVQNGLSDWRIGEGAGIANAGTLTLSDSIVEGNRVVGAFIDAGGIYNGGNMTLNNCIVVDNEAEDGYGGGGVNDGTMILNDCTLSANSADYYGGAIFNKQDGDLTVNNSTINGNSGLFGGGIYIEGGSVSLNNSTVSANSVARPEALGGGIYNQGTLDLYNVTVSDNMAPRGGGIVSDNNNVTLQNTILADNTATDAPNCYGTLGSSGYNLIGDSTGCTFLLNVGDQIDASANLGELISAQGTPRYHPLLTGSMAIDRGNPAGCAGSGGPLLTDQRGAARVGRCDVGAYEYTTPGPAASAVALSGTPQHAPPGTVFGLPLRAALLDSIGSPVGDAAVTFSAPASGASGTFADTGTYVTTASTTETGVVAASTFKANATTGPYTATATASGVVTPAHFLLGNIAWYVTPAGDDRNDCQSPEMACATINGALRETESVAGDTVLVASGTYADPGAGSAAFAEVVLLDKDVTLSGGWDSVFTTQSGTSIVDGAGSRRGIRIKGATVVIERVTIQNGFTDYSEAGGGVLTVGSLTMNDCTVIGNTANEGGGGGISSEGTLTLNNSTVSGNVADGGGGISSEGTLILNSSTVSGNVANTNGGGISSAGDLIMDHTSVSGNRSNTNGGGGITTSGTAILNNSTVDGNAATDIGSNSPNGGGIANSGVLTLNNCTVSGNTANDGDGGGIHNANTLSINSSTITGNTAKFGGGIFEGGSDWGSPHAFLRNSILAGNVGYEYGEDDCVGPLGTLGYNLIGNTFGCMFTSTAGDRISLDPLLFRLTDSPGYHPLPPGSPAVNAGNPAGCVDHLGSPLDTDQRGVPRVGRCDIGSYEFDPANDPLNHIFLPTIVRSD